MVMQAPDVMLASLVSGDPSVLLDSLKGWYAELKLDGVRAVIAQSAGQVRIYNRRRTDITARYPDVVHAVSGQFEGMLDGEIVCLDATGRPDFAVVHRRDAQSARHLIERSARTNPATFKPFDVLYDRGVDVRELQYEERRLRLEKMVVGVPPSSSDLSFMWAFVQANELEGLVLKRPGSAYRSGRQKSWVKVKATKRISAIVCGVSEGKTGRAIGSLRICLWDGNSRQMVGIGNVGSGLSEADLVMLRERLGPGQPPVVVEVEFLEVTRTGVLRMPVYKGLRNDVHPTEATLETLPHRSA